MSFLRAIVLLGTAWAVIGDPGIHSLTYIYTALSKPVDLPGIHEFTAMGILDGRIIDFYDSTLQRKVPRQPWMKEKMTPEYWNKGTRSRKSKEQWFKVNVNILMERMRQNSSDLHSLQWSHGCAVKEQADGSNTFLKGTDHYSYDGEDFLSFDEANMRWLASVPAAHPTKLKWDNVQILNQYTDGYLKKECVQWLEKFMNYSKQQVKESIPPEVFSFARKARQPGNIHLTCLATGFLPRDVVMEIRRDNKVLDGLDGVKSTGVRPNGDETHQIRKTVEIRQDDKGDYDCFVDHIALPSPIVKQWDGQCLDCTVAVISFAVSTVIVLIGLTAAIVLGLHFGKVIDLKACLKIKPKTEHGEADSECPEKRHLNDSEQKKDFDSKSKDSGKDSPSSSSGNVYETSELLERKDCDAQSKDSGKDSPSSSNGNVCEASELLERKGSENDGTPLA